jgi:hypothetical protein
MFRLPFEASNLWLSRSACSSYSHNFAKPFSDHEMFLSVSNDFLNDMH